MLDMCSRLMFSDIDVLQRHQPLWLTLVLSVEYLCYHLPQSVYNLSLS